jgi:Luciferase
MRSHTSELKKEVSAWPHISVHLHRFGGWEFLFDKAEVGHVHIGGVVDIPFTRTIHDALLEENLAEEHRWVPNSGWTTFRMRSENDLERALWLMRLSYLRYQLKETTEPDRLLQHASEDLHLSPRFTSLLAPFALRRRDQPSA